ncbi:PH domain-containing protein [Pedobacter sp. JY14-1]|uniref:PH domain-containing protein n=1 Tax=Pedobacter sp. JY14-1 TaxID=3034151 RepID=UPI0023E26E8E|nr:PH domain-containing protein [Pedobacter sp. JY14-1]
MNLIDRFLSDEQDPKAVEKVLGKLNDMLTQGEELIYLAVQKKPAVNLLPDCIAVSTKRMFYCTPGNLGFTMNFKDISWKSIKEVSFKEEIFGSKFICVPLQGENIVTEYIPKVQARKLYQAAYAQLEEYKEQLRQTELEERRSSTSPVTVNTAPAAEPVEERPVPPAPVFSPPAAPVQEQEDETTLKLRKLKTLYDKQLITLEEYESKKADILDSL